MWFVKRKMSELAAQHHGKLKVRLGRVWRDNETAAHRFVEWTVHTMLESDMEHAYLVGTNTDMTATDTQKNTVRRGPFDYFQRDNSTLRVPSSANV